MQKTPNEPRETPPMPPPQEGGIDEAMHSVQQAPDALSEHIPESIKHPKEGLAKAIDTAKQTIIGSKSIPTEISNLKDSYLDFYKQAITSNLKTLGKLATLHPIQAVKEFALGTTGNLKSIANIVTSPSRLAVAGGASVVDLAKKTAKLPFQAAAWVAKSPLGVWGILNRGAGKLSEMEKKFQSWNKGG